MTATHHNEIYAGFGLYPSPVYSILEVFAQYLLIPGTVLAYVTHYLLYYLPIVYAPKRHRLALLVFWSPLAVKEFIHV